MATMSNTIASASHDTVRPVRSDMRSSAALSLSTVMLFTLLVALEAH